jgi:hypothetical protein
VALPPAVAAVADVVGDAQLVEGWEFGAAVGQRVEVIHGGAEAGAAGLVPLDGAELAVASAAGFVVRFPDRDAFRSQLPPFV